MKVYSDIFDADYDDETGEWLEGACGHPDCQFCANRPARFPIPIYLEETVVTVVRKYNPKYGDDRVCVCGHPYYRHFDTYEKMSPVGCKYCQCGEFKEQE